MNTKDGQDKKKPNYGSFYTYVLTHLKSTNVFAIISLVNSKSVLVAN